MIPCSWKSTFGIECPSCGAQRSFFELLNGGIWSSIEQFPALIPILFLAVYSMLHIWKPTLFPAKVIVMSVIFVGVLILGNWVVKLIG